MTSQDLESFANSIAERGWAATAPIVDHGTIADLRAAVARLAMDGRGGARNLLDFPEIQTLASSDLVRGLASVVLGTDCFATRALLFDKRPESNWKVIWHQDLTIAARARADVRATMPGQRRRVSPMCSRR